MKRPARIIAIVFASITAFFLLIMLGVQIFLNSGKARKIVDNVAVKAIDGSFVYSRLRFDVFGSFPSIRVTIDTVSITYPSERFACQDGLGREYPLLDAGRSDIRDTLAAFDHFTAAINPLHMISKRYRLRDASLSGLKVYAHAYSDSSANWQIIRALNKEKDTLSKGFSLPSLKLGLVRLMDKPIFIYTSRKDTLYALAEMKEMSLRGDMRRFLLDSLELYVCRDPDSLAFFMEHLRLQSPGLNAIDIDASANALLAKDGKGSLRLPINLTASVSYSKSDEKSEIDLRHFLLQISDIPIKASGLLQMLGDSNYVKAALNIDDQPIGKSLELLAGSGLVPLAEKFSTNARISLSAEADGYISKTGLPKINASLIIPESAVFYKPMNINARFRMNMDAGMSPEKLLGATINNMEISAEGANIGLVCKAQDLLGKDPSIAAHLKGDADLDAFRRFLSDSLRLSGLADIKLDAVTKLSEIKDFNFKEGAVKGEIIVPAFSLEKPYDSLRTDFNGCKILLSSQKQGFKADMGLDSVSFSKGSAMRARVREMLTQAEITQVSLKGKTLSKVSLESNNSRVYFRIGDQRMGTRDLNLTASLQKRVRGNRGPRPRRGRPVLTESDFVGKDIKVDLGQDVVNFLREWSPSAGIMAKSGFYANPRLPLRNRIKGIDLQYNDDSFDLNTLEITSGTSDLSVSGKITGLRRTLLGRGFLRGDLKVDSKRLNLNELLSALEVGKDNDYKAKSETDESFVTDTLANAQFRVDSTMSVIVIPANLDAKIALHADNLDYSDIAVSPFDAQINVAKRCVQITDTKLSTNLGDVVLDAFYATRSKKDIQIGADLQLMDMSAAGIIHMLPTVDRMIPALKSFKGNLGCRVSFTSQLDTMMNVQIPTLDGLVRITGKELEIKDAGELRKITRLLMFKNKNIGRIDDLAMDAVIENSQVEIYPFILGVDRYKVALMGVQNLDRTMHYNISIIKTPVLPMRFGINIQGSLDDFRFSIGRSKYHRGEVPVFKQEIDDIQYNIGDAIRNVFERGVENALASTRQSYMNLQKRKRELGYDSNLPKDFLSNHEYQQLEAKAFEEEMKEYNAKVEAEVEAILSESAKK
jgi:hypothetical protein